MVDNISPSNSVNNLNEINDVGSSEESKIPICQIKNSSDKVSTVISSIGIGLMISSLIALCVGAMLLMGTGSLGGVALLAMGGGNGDRCLNFYMRR